MLKTMRKNTGNSLQAKHHFRNAAFIEDNDKATNSSNYRYRLNR